MLQYPDRLLQINEFFNGIYPSGNPLYFLLGANVSENPDNLVENGFITLNLKYSYLGSPIDINFNLFGINYKNNTVINGANQFLKTLDTTVLTNSIISCFEKSGLLDEYTFSRTIYLASQTISIILEKKDRAFINFSTDFELFNQSSNWNDYRKLTVNNQYNTIRHNFHQGLTVIDDINQFEVLLKIYKHSIDNQSSEYLTSLNKKFLSNGKYQICDFDVSKILDDSISKYKPSIFNFGFKNIKIIEKFSISSYQKFVDKRVDETNNFSDMFGYNTYTEFWAIKQKYDLFEVYENKDYYLNYFNILTNGYLSVPIPDRMVQTNLEGIDLENKLYNKLLTKQPKYKALNKSYELLFNQVSTIGEGILNDVAEITFYYDDETESIYNHYASETYNFIGTTRYINEFCFNVDNLKNYISNTYTWNEVSKIKVTLKNLTYDTNTFETEPVAYEEMIYFIDKTSNQCVNILEETVINYTPIIFLNSLGGFDLFEFEEIQEFKSKRDYESINTPYTFESNKLDDFEKVYNISYTSNYLIKSRTLTNEEFIWLKDLIVSKEVYILKGTELIPIIMNDVDYNYKNTDDKVLSISFNYSRPDNI